MATTPLEPNRIIPLTPGNTQTNEDPDHPRDILSSTFIRDNVDNDDDDTDNDEEEFDFITSQWENGVEIGLTISWPGSHRPLQLSTKLTEDRIAPLFDGTQWAGTRVWKAAVVALEYLLSLQLSSSTTTITTTTTTNNPQQPYPSLLELGCGLGVPAMIWHLLQEASHVDTPTAGATSKPLSRVVLTDMPDLLPQLEANVRHNFPDSYGTCIQAKPLDWSKEGLQTLWKQEQEQQRELEEKRMTTSSEESNLTDRRHAPVFDICLNCDCIYEPLYGRKAWESLADVLAEVARVSPSTLIVTSVERRTGDGVEEFWHRLQDSGTIQSVQQVIRNDEDPHHIIEVYVTKGIEVSDTSSI